MVSDCHKVVLLNQLEALLFLSSIRFDEVIRAELNVLRPEFGEVVGLLKRLHAADTIVVNGVLLQFIDTLSEYCCNLLLWPLDSYICHLFLRENILYLTHVCVFVTQLPRGEGPCL